MFHDLAFKNIETYWIPQSFFFCNKKNFINIFTILFILPLCYILYIWKSIGFAILKICFPLYMTIKQKISLLLLIVCKRKNVAQMERTDIEEKLIMFYNLFPNYRIRLEFSWQLSTEQTNQKIKICVFKLIDRSDWE